jgi:hypothetical protein
VYVTHDLTFTLSRRSATYVLISPTKDVQVLDIQHGIADSVVASLLGAASFSVYACRIVFCEGAEGRSADWDLYTAWFEDRSTAVIPVGSCRDVIACVESFGSSRLVVGVQSMGIIDLDLVCGLCGAPSGRRLGAEGS